MLVRKTNSLELIQILKSIEGKSSEDIRKIYEIILRKLSWIPSSLSARYRRFDNYQDILQIGYMTLFRAILSYDYTKSSNVVGYVYPWVKTEIRKEAWHHKEYLQKTQLMSKAEEINTLIIEGPEEEFIRNEEFIIMKNILKKLDNNSNMVIVRTFDLDGFGKSSLRQLAEEMKVSHETVRKMRLQALKKMVLIHSKIQSV